LAHTEEEMQVDGKVALRNKVACFAESIGFNMSNTLLKNLATMPAAAAARGFRGKMAGVAFEGARCRTTYSRNIHGFGNGGSFSDALKSFALEAIKKKRMETGEPIYIIIDYTTSAVSKGRAKSGASIEGAGWHFSHPGGTTACGHQIAAVLIGCGDLLSAYEFFNFGNSGGLSAAEKGIVRYFAARTHPAEANPGNFLPNPRDSASNAKKQSLAISAPWLQSRVLFAVIPENAGRSGNASAGFSAAEQAQPPSKSGAAPEKPKMPFITLKAFLLLSFAAEIQCIPPPAQASIAAERAAPAAEAQPLNPPLPSIPASAVDSLDLPPVSDVFIRIPALEPERFSDPGALRQPPTHPPRPDSRPSADRIPFPQPGSRSGFTAALMDGIIFSAIFSYISAPAFSNAWRNAP
jgi:hypothetical protein